MRTFGLLAALLVATPIATPIARVDQEPVVSTDTTAQDVSRPDENINARYVVEQADVHGLSEDDLSEGLQDDLRALVGQRLDSGAADRLQERIGREFPDHAVSRRIERGTEVGRIRVVFEAERREDTHWLRFEPLRTNALYHSEQGWGAYLDSGIGDGTIRFTPIVAIDHADDLVEEYSGYGLRFETRKLGTRRLGASVEWTRFDQDWRDATLAALEPGSPRLYEDRQTFTPLLKFAITPHLSLSGGVSITELDPLTPGLGSQMANAVIGAIEFDRRWKATSDATHHLVAGFGVRGGSRDLESDLAYTRYLGQGAYRFDAGRHHVEATGMAGGLTGDAPLFERFTLGDSKTLRGWDKYEIAPAGADRMFHSSVEYRYTGVGLFLDVGSVWNTGTEQRVRVSTGFTLQAGPAFFIVGVPLNTDSLSAIVMMGLRMPGVGARW